MRIVHEVKIFKEEKIVKEVKIVKELKRSVPETAMGLFRSDPPPTPRLAQFS